MMKQIHKTFRSWESPTNDTRGPTVGLGWVSLVPWNSPDATTVGPVPGHPGGQEQGGDGLVEQEVVVDELLLLLICHVLQGVVRSFQVPVQDVKTCPQQTAVKPSITPLLGESMGNRLSPVYHPTTTSLLFCFNCNCFLADGLIERN